METKVTRITRHIETIAQFNSSLGDGCTRFSYSKEDMEAKAYLTEEFGKIGMSVSVDSVGNLLFRDSSRSGDDPVVIVGSHIDTVPNGGNYDGVVGVIGGLEVAQCIHEAGIDLPFSLEVMVFAEEEGSNFGSTMLGSKALIGKFPDTEAFHTFRNDKGVSWYSMMEHCGLVPDTMEYHRLDPEKVLALFELHIEQGIVLEREKKQIGVVEVIAGMQTFEITVTGQSNHAGSTPMQMRNDPAAGAAEIILVIERIAREKVGVHTVATVGRISAKPGGSNVIPESVSLSLDVRDVTNENIQKAADLIRAEAEHIAFQRGLSVDFHLVGASEAVPLSEKVVLRLVKQVTQMDIPFMLMNSGAVHDAAMIAEVCDVGMIFVPSRDGLSHTAEEFTEYEDIKAGCDLLLNTILDFS